MMKNITVEITGTGTHNRGAELMAIAIADQVRRARPDATVVVPHKFGADADRAYHNFLTTWEAVGRFGLAKTLVLAAAWGMKKNVVSPGSVDVVLDASGFAFSDQWGAGPAEVLLRKMSRPYRRRQPLILLPQAFGPFEEPAVRSAVKRLAARASLIFARDSTSYAAIRDLVGPEKVRKCPDFTVAVAPVADPTIRLPSKFVAVVPNLRMVDKTQSGAAYLDFLRRAITQIHSRDLAVAFVLHDAEEDRRVVDMLGQSFHDLPILSHRDPRVLKWILGQSQFVIGSRFHALVSSLSQGVPCVGAGWSHKYPELFKDFACEEFLIADMADNASLSAVLNVLCDPTSHARVAREVAAASDLIKQRATDMWHEVGQFISHSERST